MKLDNQEESLLTNEHVQKKRPILKRWGKTRRRRFFKRAVFSIVTCIGPMSSYVCSDKISEKLIFWKWRNLSWKYVVKFHVCSLQLCTWQFFKLSRTFENIDIKCVAKSAWVFLGKVFWDYAANLQKSTHVEVWFQ